MRAIHSLSALTLLLSLPACGAGTLEPPRPPSALVADLNPEPEVPAPTPADQIPEAQRTMCAPSEAGLICYTTAQVAEFINALRNEVRVRGARFYGLRDWTLAPSSEAD